MKQKTKDRKLAEFISNAIEVHNGKYGYDKFVFVNKTTKGVITCPIHGDFLQTPKNHLNGHGCPVCGKEYAKSCHKKDYDGFLKSARERHGSKYEYPHIKTEYINSHSTITIRCNDCGNVFTKVACDHITSNDGGCRVCRRKENIQYFTYYDLKCLVADGLVVKPFDGCKTKNDKCVMLCDEHGEYEVKVSTLLKDRGKCKACSSKSMTAVEFDTKLRNKYSNEFSFNRDEYVNMSIPVTFTCSEHGHTFRRTPTAMLNGSHYMTCPVCSKEVYNIDRRKSTEEFIHQLEGVYGKDAFDTSGLVYTKSSEYVTLVCKECGRTFTKEANSLLQGHGCPYHHMNTSTPEDEITDFLTGLGEHVVTNDRKTLPNRYELDILLPEHKLAIEFDGIFWHNELLKDKQYHLNKTVECEKKGIRLLHIFEDEWRNKSDIWKSMLCTILRHSVERIYARKCNVCHVDSKTAREFIDKNHLQGKCNSQYNYGLYYDGELVSLMTFGKTRHFIGGSSHQYELLRFCSKLGMTVVGGASKLLSHFIEDMNPQSIVSYADRRWSCGNLYDRLGFTLYNKSNPNYYYIINGERKNRFNFRKSILIKKYGCPQEMSEHEFCLQNKWYRIYDCGCLCYEWKGDD